MCRQSPGGRTIERRRYLLLTRLSSRRGHDYNHHLDAMVVAVRLPPPGDQEEFYANLLKACRTETEKAVCMLLWRTGMHASTLCNRDFFWCGTEHLNRDKDNWALCWERPKTGASMRAIIPRAEARVIRDCLFAGLLPNTTRTLHRWVARIGDRAGYAGVCPLTLRHSRTIYLRQNGLRLEEVATLMGCSVEVVVKYYAQQKAGDLADKAARLVE